jgi:hypothetical protein
MPSKPKPKPKAKGASSASKPRKAAVKSNSKSPPKAGVSPKPASVGDWRVETLSRMRALIKEADPDMIEERKWVKPTKPLGVPVWSHDGIVCTGETYKQVVKLTFMYGASLPDPSRLFNSSMEGGTRRALDIPEGTQVDARAFKALIKAAVAFNTSKKKR